MNGLVPVFEHSMLGYISEWRTAALTTFVAPGVTLIGLSLGIGSLTDRVAFDGQSVPYVAFIASGLIVALGAQAAAFESTLLLHSRLREGGRYQMLRAVPVSARAVIAGEFASLALRVATATCAYLLLVAAMGRFELSLYGMAVVITGTVATALAFAGPISAFTTTQGESDRGLQFVLTLGVTPLVMLSGVFFPESVLPDTVRELIQVTPLHHGVALARTAFFGSDGQEIGRILFLGLIDSIGFILAAAALRRRLRR